MTTKPRIGVLALQGDYERHIQRVRELGADAFAVRLPQEIEASDAVILPGGESTTIGKLMVRYGLDEAIKAAHKAGKPIYGTCAGMILLARRIEEDTQEHGGQPTLGLLDVTVRRNAFGRQVESFEADLESDAITGKDDAPLRAVFIRAPVVTALGKGVKTLASYGGKVVFVRERNIIASAFHPELTADDRVHRYFLRIVRGD
jgi:5'-phosphate synthase pdxT subunit